MLIPTLVVLAIAQQPAPRFPDFPQQDMVRYDVDLNVDIAAERLSGHVDYEIRALAPLESVRLHALRSDSWQPRFLTFADEELPAKWDDERQIVELELSSPIETGSSFSFRAVLAGHPVDGFYFKKSRYGEPLAFTDHYSIRARGWLPCEDHPADRAVWNSAITYPTGTECLGYGRRSEAGERSTPDGFATAVFRSEVEIAPYMYSVVVGPFTHVPEAGDARLVGHWVYSQDADEARKVLVHHAEWIAWMEQHFGTYPFTKYATVQCPTRWGGFESPEVVLVSEALYDSERGIGTLAHELVHMWFGDAVGYARWREVWLSEGFASYFGPILWSRTGGPDLASAMRAMRGRWLKSFEGRTKSVRDDSFPHPNHHLNANTYPKGAWVL
ncbi:MAG: hypothetical protein KDB80_05360, partial [Planctomycetes bacterium]|nr:hypothetical protein [Planctomycetota bacterium]